MTTFFNVCINFMSVSLRVSSFPIWGLITRIGYCGIYFYLHGARWELYNFGKCKSSSRTVLQHSDFTKIMSCSLHDEIDLVSNPRWNFRVSVFPSSEDLYRRALGSSGNSGPNLLVWPKADPASLGSSKSNLIYTTARHMYRDTQSSCLEMLEIFIRPLHFLYPTSDTLIYPALLCQGLGEE